jgi:hypothetical protein
MAALNLAEQIDAYILGYADERFQQLRWYPGNGIALYDDVASGYTRLKEEGTDGLGPPSRSDLLRQASSGFGCRNGQRVSDQSR